MSAPQKEIYDILTGKVKLPPKMMRVTDNDPHLIMKIKVPDKDKEYIPRSQVIDIKQIITNPSQNLAAAYLRAQEDIIEEMEKNKEMQEKEIPMIRYQKGLITIPVKEKRMPFLSERNEVEQMELECVHQWTGLMDVFWLQYNAILYVLQRECGFRIKAFMLYD